MLSSELVTWMLTGATTSTLGTLFKIGASFSDAAAPVRPHEVIDVAWPHKQVHANAVCTLMKAIDLAQHDGCNRQDHDDFNCNGDRRDQRTQRTMYKVADNKGIHTPRW